MVLNPLRIFLFLAGVAVAALGVAYFSGALDPVLFGTPAQVASAPDQPAGETGAKGERLHGAGDAAEEAARTNGAAAGKSARLVPTFDVVRVEPDGSVVIAGHASPKAKVEIIAGGDAVVAAGASDAGGDFAIVFDDPLKPGDYQLTLRATPPEGEAVASAQTAIVSIPDKADGQVLAMVEEPGKASQVITAPQPVAEPAQETAAAEQPARDVASAEPAETKPAETDAGAMKSAEPADETAPPAMAAEGKPDQVAEARPDEASEPAEKPAGMASTEPSRAAGESPDQDSETMASAEPTPQEAEPAEPAQQADKAARPAEEKPAAPASDMASAEPGAGEAMTDETKPAEAGADVAKSAEPARQPAEAAKPAEEEPAAPESDMASAEPNPAESSEPARPAPAKSAPSVSVQAVEIEGEQIFVAGDAEPGRTVRVYANEVVLGEAKAAPNGRFLVEARKDLAVGNYIIRADMLGDDGARVIARAAVPFEREPGESIAAVAPSEPARTEEKPAEVASSDTPAAESPPAIEEKPAKVASGETPSAPAAGKSTEMAAAEPKAPASGEQASRVQDTTAEPARSARVAEEPASPAEVAEEPAKTAEPAEMAVAEPKAPASGEQASKPEDATEEPAKPADMASAEPPAPIDDKQMPRLDNDIATSPPEVLSAKLRRTNDAVIIRRGDSLWRISRRVYGRGIRYSTIYLANQEQIKDPDLIWPGQIFEVPEKTKEGERADMSKIGDQATTSK